MRNASVILVIAAWKGEDTQEVVARGSSESPWEDMMIISWVNSTSDS